MCTAGPDCQISVPGQQLCLKGAESVTILTDFLPTKRESGSYVKQGANEQADVGFGTKQDELSER